MSNKLIFVISGVILIVFVVLCVYTMNDSSNHLIENYNNHNTNETENNEPENNENTNETTKESENDKIENKLKQSGMKTDDVNEFLENLKRQDELFLEQQKKQNLQNREIKLLKQKVDDFRNDLIILKDNDKKMMDTLNRDDLEEDEESDMDNSNFSSFKSLDNNTNTREEIKLKKSNISGKSYNLNFNLDED